jgi:hypothetical protein
LRRIVHNQCLSVLGSADALDCDLDLSVPNNSIQFNSGSELN